MNRNELLVNEENYPTVSSEFRNYQDITITDCLEEEAIVILYKVQGAEIIGKTILFTDYVSVDYFGSYITLEGSLLRSKLITLKFELEYYDFIVEVRDKENTPLYIFTLNEIVNHGIFSNRDLLLKGKVFRTKYRKLTPIENVILIEDILRKRYSLNAITVYESIYGNHNMIVRVNDAIDLGEELTEYEIEAMKMMKFKSISDGFVLIDLSNFSYSNGSEVNYEVVREPGRTPRCMRVVDTFNQFHLGFSHMELIESNGNYHTYKVTGVNKHTVDGSVIISDLYKLDGVIDIDDIEYSNDNHEVVFTLKIKDKKSRNG